MTYEDDESYPNSDLAARAAGGLLVDPQQLVQLVMAARAAQQVGQGTKAAPPTLPVQALVDSVLAPTDPFVAGARTIRPTPLPNAKPDGALAIQNLPHLNSDEPPVIQKLAYLNAPAKATVIQKLREPAQASRQAVSPAPSRVIDARPWTKAASRIPRPAADPDVKPNLRVSDPKRLRTTLGGLMQGIREAPRPGVLRHLTPTDEQAAAHESYGESSRGTVREHEAMISVMVNRLRSPQRRHYVDRGQEYTVDNVIHAHAAHSKHHQFQGIDNRAYREFGNDQGSQNARTAAANIAAHGPTNNATAFIVIPDGKEPKPNGRLERNLGHVHRVGRVGNVFLYAEDAPSQRRPQTHGVPGHDAAAHSLAQRRR